MMIMYPFRCVFVCDLLQVNRQRNVKRRRSISGWDEFHFRSRGPAAGIHGWAKRCWWGSAVWCARRWWRHGWRLQRLAATVSSSRFSPAGRRAAVRHLRVPVSSRWRPLRLCVVCRSLPVAGGRWLRVRVTSVCGQRHARGTGCRRVNRHGRPPHSSDHPRASAGSGTVRRRRCAGLRRRGHAARSPANLAGAGRGSLETLSGDVLSLRPAAAAPVRRSTVRSRRLRRPRSASRRHFQRPLSRTALETGRFIYLLVTVLCKNYSENVSGIAVTLQTIVEKRSRTGESFKFSFKCSQAVWGRQFW